MDDLKRKSKRKAGQKEQVGAKPLEDNRESAEVQSDYESDQVNFKTCARNVYNRDILFQENFLTEIQENESSDDEQFHESDSADDLSFESFGEDESEDEKGFTFNGGESSDEFSEPEVEEASGEETEEDDPTEDTVEKVRKSEDQDRIKKLVEQRQLEKVQQKAFSEIIKENLRHSDDGYLKNLEREKPTASESKLGEPGTSGEGKSTVEYEDDGDSSDEEDIRNTVGNIPLQWYDEYKHIGYDWDGKKIIKPQKGDQIDNFLKKMEDPDFWRTVKDPQTGQDVVLSEEDIQLIKQIMKNRNPDKSFDEYPEWVDWFTSEVEQMPIRNIPDSKRSFLPSKIEKKQIGRLVHSLKMGWMKTKAEQDRIDKERKVPKFFMLWETDSGREKMRRIHDHVAAPRRALPGHAESYNPPPEYLFNENEQREWNKMKDEPHKRKLHFLPQKYKSLRQVPYYERYIRERFLRCLDLYLCPRAKRTKVTVQPEDLIPKLPSPRDLQPFPTTESMVYRGHTDLIRAISIEPKGQYIVTGSDDMSIKIWEIATGRCIKTIKTKGVVRSVAWCPNPKISLIAVATDKRCLLINPYVGDIKLISKKTDDILAESPVNDQIENEKIKAAIQWTTDIDEDEKKDGVRIVINHFQEIKQVTWHGRGDYFATVMPSGVSITSNKGLRF